jgi:hypothetical protein
MRFEKDCRFFDASAVLYRDLAATHVIADALELSGLSADKVLDLVGFDLPETHYRWYFQLVTVDNFAAPLFSMWEHLLQPPLASCLAERAP